MIFMALAGLLFVLFRNILPTLYVSEPEVIQITAGLLVIVAFFQLSDGAQAVGIGILRGITDMKVPTLLTLAAYWIIGLPVAYALAFWADMGIYGVWIGLLLSRRTFNGVHARRRSVINRRHYGHCSRIKFRRW